MRRVPDVQEPARARPSAPRSGAADWGRVAHSRDRLPRAWRRHGRVQHLDLFGRWIGVPEGRWLKTDLFEERTEDRALIPFLQPASWIGIDIAVGVAAQVGAGEYQRVVADVRALPFRSGAFDGVLSTSTLDHFPDKVAVVEAIAELARVVTPGGQVMLTLDNPQNLLIWLRSALPARLVERTGLAPYGVGATLSEGEGRRALAAAGLAVVAVEHLLHTPHVVGTRLAAFRWYAAHALPAFDRLARTPLARRTGHYVAFLARRPGLPLAP